MDETRPASQNSDAARDDAVTLHAEELHLGKADQEYGVLRAQKQIETQAVSESVPRLREEARVDRVPAHKGDSGQIETLPDGSISIPVLEEELVITKRVVVRERIVIRKETTTEKTRVTDELRKENVEISETNAEVRNAGLPARDPRA
jgi:uncharacterized protein (TIGR02271 family)